VKGCAIVVLLAIAAVAATAHALGGWDVLLPGLAFGVLAGTPTALLIIAPDLLKRTERDFERELQWQLETQKQEHYRSNARLRGCLLNPALADRPWVPNRRAAALAAWRRMQSIGRLSEGELPNFSMAPYIGSELSEDELSMYAGDAYPPFHYGEKLWEPCQAVK
jgi:hypothetical protein